LPFVFCFWLPHLSRRIVFFSTPREVDYFSLPCFLRLRTLTLPHQGYANVRAIAFRHYRLPCFFLGKRNGPIPKILPVQTPPPPPPCPPPSPRFASSSLVFARQRRFFSLFAIIVFPSYGTLHRPPDRSATPTKCPRPTIAGLSAVFALLFLFHPFCLPLILCPQKVAQAFTNVFPPYSFLPRTNYTRVPLPILPGTLLLLF